MIRLFCILILLHVSASASAATVIYLHGKIIEDKGDNAVHPEYGTYQYGRIIAELKAAGHHVISEVRPANTNRTEYAKTIVHSIETLLSEGTPPNDIVVMGFSKGAQIAILVSQALANPEVRFVLQAVCGSWVAHYNQLQIYGNVLSMYETSDLAGSCNALFQKSPALACEIAISTGLRHGAFYKPIDEWLIPLRQWINHPNCHDS